MATWPPKQVGQTLMTQGSERQSFWNLAIAVCLVATLSLQEEGLLHRPVGGKPVECFDPLVAHSDIYLHALDPESNPYMV